MPKQEACRIANGRGQTLAAVLHLPDVVTREPWAVLSHGMLSTKDSRKHVALAERLCELGFAAVRYDFSGQGESEGRPDLITYSNGVGDLRAVIESFKPRGAKRFLLIGSSLGSGVSMLAAPGLKDDVAGLALMAAIYRTNIIWGAMRPEQRERWEREGAFEFQGRPVAFDIIEDGRRLDVAGGLAAFPGPALFVHGTKDELIPPERIPPLAERHPGPTEVVFVEGADHRFSEDAHRARLVETIAQWADRRFPVR
ncbi:MAG: alpha/beta hydrolase [Myxococcales bacterium]|nr:MAG: alpha/beta hydrolase [Myxococcales bacterium]